MGFRCPICHKDFKQDKKEWKKHCKNYHFGAAQEAVDMVKDVCEDNE